MIIKLIEPIGVSKDVINEMAVNIRNQGHEFYYYDTKSKDVEEMKIRVVDADILMIANTPLPAEVINVAKNLKYISVAFTGVDHIDLDACKKQGIMISNSAGYSDVSVAELVLGLTLDLYRNISIGNNVVRKSGTIQGLIGNEIKGKTVGIVGTGRIGRETAKLFKAFNTRVIGYDIDHSDEAKALGIEYVSYEHLLTESDIISLHVPNIASTKAMIDAVSLEKMKSNAVLINCARGPVVDNKALADALNNNVIAGAGIDVYDMEPPIPSDYPLLHAKNTVLTPHVAYASEESMLLRASIVFDNVLGYIEDKLINIVQR